MSERSDWFYIWLALGLSWTVLAGYAVFLLRRLLRTEREVRSGEGT